MPSWKDILDQADGMAGLATATAVPRASMAGMGMYQPQQPMTDAPGVPGQDPGFNQPAPTQIQGSDQGFTRPRNMFGVPNLPPPTQLQQTMRPDLNGKMSPEEKLDAYMQTAGVPAGIRQTLFAPGRLMEGYTGRLGELAGAAGNTAMGVAKGWDKTMQGALMSLVGGSGLVPAAENWHGSEKLIGGIKDMANAASAPFLDVMPEQVSQSPTQTAAPQEKKDQPGQKEGTVDPDPIALADTMNATPPTNEDTTGTIYFQGALKGRGEDTSGTAASHGTRAMDPGGDVRDIGINENEPTWKSTGGYVTGRGSKEFERNQTLGDLAAARELDAAQHQADLARLRVQNPDAFNRYIAGQLEMQKRANRNPAIDAANEFYEAQHKQYQDQLRTAAGIADPKARKEMQDAAEAADKKAFLEWSTAQAGAQGKTPGNKVLTEDDLPH